MLIRMREGIPFENAKRCRDGPRHREARAGATWASPSISSDTWKFRAREGILLLGAPQRSRCS